MALLETPVGNLGWCAPDFELTSADGISHRLGDYAGDRGVLVAFICNHCPYVKAIIDRLVADALQLREAGVAVLAVMPNDYTTYPADSPQNMQRFAEQHHFGFPYLIDEDQAVARAFGAVCTPDFFGFNKKGELQYRGRIDNLEMRSAGKRDAELLKAMLMIAQTGSASIEQHPSIGCSIKWR